MHIAPRLARRTPFFYGWAILGAAGSAYFVRDAAASLTLAVFMVPVADELGWNRTLIAGAASVGFSLGGVVVLPSVAFADYFGRLSLGPFAASPSPSHLSDRPVGAVLSGAIYDLTGSYHAAFLTFAVLSALTILKLLIAKPPTRSQPAVSA